MRIGREMPVPATSISTSSLPARTAPPCATIRIVPAVQCLSRPGGREPAWWLQSTCQGANVMRERSRHCSDCTKNRQHEKRNLSPVYRVSIARLDSKRIPRRDGPSAASRRPRQVPRSKLSCIVFAKSEKLAANATRPGVRCDDLAVCPWQGSTRSPSEPAPAAASPLNKRAVWFLALNRIGDVLWWGRSFGAAGKRASGQAGKRAPNSARVGRASAAKPGRNKGSKLGRLSISEQLANGDGSWSRIR